MNRKQRRQQKAGGRLPGKTSQADSIGAALDAAIQHYRQGRLAEAETVCRQILRLRANHALALNMLGLVLMGKGQTDEAAACLRGALQTNPYLPEAHYNLGNLLLGRGEAAEAAASFHWALKIRPDYAEASNNLGNALKAQGKFDEAAVSYRRALAIRPKYPEALNNLGILLNERRKPDEAIACYRKAIKFEPRYAPAHNNLGIVLRDQGKLDEAIAAFRQALDIDPNMALAYFNIGHARHLQHRLQQAAEQFRRALAINPNLPQVHDNLGSVLNELDRPDEASACYRRAIEIDPGYAQAHSNLGVLFKEQGKLGEAVSCFQRAVEIDPAFSKAHYNLTTLRKHGAGDPDIAAMEALADNPATAREDAFNLCFSLGSVYHDMGSHDRAFEYLARGNALKRQSIDFNIEILEKLAQDTIGMFSEAFLSQFEGAGCPSELPVFIVGMPRSGTSLVEQILASHHAVHGAGELRNLDWAATPQALGSALPFPHCLGELDNDGWTKLGEAYVDAVRKLAPTKQRIVDKMPANYFYIGLIRLAMPNARIIHCVRDPVDTCFSCYRILFSEGLQHFSYDLVELGRNYRQYRQLMRHWHTVLKGRILDVPYEGVVADPEDWARRLVDFCGLEWDDACLEFHKTDRPVRTASAAQVRQPIYKTSMQLWRRYERHLGPLLDELGLSEGPQGEKARAS